MHDTPLSQHTCEWTSAPGSSVSDRWLHADYNDSTSYYEYDAIEDGVEAAEDGAYAAGVDGVAAATAWLGRRLQAGSSSTSHAHVADMYCLVC